MHYALTLHKHQAAARTEHEQTALQRHGERPHPLAPSPFNGEGETRLSRTNPAIGGANGGEVWG